jgi:hypothetical protein
MHTFLPSCLDERVIRMMKEKQKVKYQDLIII